jgi:diguanylate cyclase (GGDEF)-like protein
MIRSRFSAQRRRMHDADDNPTTQRTRISSGPTLPGPRSACVVVIHGEGLGKRVDIDDAAVRVGRSKDNDLLIVHPSVSRHHCEIWREADSYRVRDLGATNRTRVNDVAIDAAELRDGDHITVGESLLKFISHESPEAGYHAEVYQLVTHDALTDLVNRRHFTEQLDAAIDRALDAGTPLCLAIVDVDLFKPINDRWGHIAGDAVLRQIAGHLRRAARAGDLAGRIGGEEFALLLADTALDDASAQVEALRAAVEADRFLLDGQPQRITISIGLAALDAGRTTRPALMRAADLALYRAKEGGRNRVCSALPSD